MNRTIDQAANWVSRLERAGFEIETETEEISAARALVVVRALHATGEKIVIWLVVQEAYEIDSRFTKFASALRHEVAGLPTRSTATSKRYVVDMIVDDAIDNVNFLLPFPSGVSA